MTTIEESGAEASFPSRRTDPSTIQGKFLVQYTGGYTCPGDGPPFESGHHGWSSWFSSVNPINPELEHPLFEMLPDVSLYSPSELFDVPGFQTNANANISLFSSRNQTTVRRHFRWMAEHNVDGALYRFWAGHLRIQYRYMRNIRDDVLECIREAAEKEGRVFAIQYDLDDIPAEHAVNLLEEDWNYLVNMKGVLSSLSYLQQDGRPVISLLGLGFPIGDHTPTLLRSIVAMFRAGTPGGAYIMTSVPVLWRWFSEENGHDSGFVDVWLNEFDALSPIQSPTRREWENDLEFIQEHVSEKARAPDYIPALYPGASNYNWNGARRESDWNAVKRDGGRLLWDQIHTATTVGVRTLLVESWDGYSGGTALMPVVSYKAGLPSSDKVRIMALDEDGYDLPPDWYMRICGLAAEAFHEGQTIPEHFLLKELDDYWVKRPALEHEICTDFLLKLFDETASVWRRLNTRDLELPDARCLVNFLGKILDTTTLPREHPTTKRILSLSFRISRSFHVFPASYELRGVQCDLNKPLHEGGFGYVCKGVHKDRTVCVKAVRLYERQDSVQHLQALAKELILWSHLSHPNIVPFYGVWIPGTSLSRICVVSPWMDNGNLSHYLKQFPEASQTLLLSDVGAGLKYLHSSNIIHADLKACNVLVSELGRAMITDFGASHIAMTSSTTTTQSAITPHWTAPELVMEDDVRPTRASDVWAFGCVMYEVTTGKTPFYAKTPLQVLSALMKGTITPLKADPERASARVDEGLQKLMNDCWNYDERRRPTAEEIVQYFVDLGTADNRPLPMVEASTLMASHRASSQVRIDYDCIYGILNQVRKAPLFESGETRGSDEGEAGKHEVNEIVREGST